MLKKYLLQLKTHHRRAWREQKGQSLIIFVFAILALIAMMGLALDLGLVYIERVRISRTTDAAALASVVELPFEEEAIRRAIEFIELNGYRPGIDTEIKVRGCIVVGNELKNVSETGALVGTAKMTPKPPPDRFNQGFSYPGTLTPAPEDKVATFVIDTLSYQPAFDQDDPPDGVVDTRNEEACDGNMTNPQTGLFGTANKLRVSGEVRVGMNFMRFFGWDTFPVVDEAVGENVTNLDVVVVFDISGSMDYETNCFGCFTEDPALSANILAHPFPNNGTFNPLRYPAGTVPAWGKGSPANDLTKAGHNVCSQPATPLDTGTYKYSVHEAELYSDNGIGNNSVIQPWLFERREVGQGFWVLQRPGEGSNSAYMRPHSFVTYSQINLSDVPRLQGGAYNAECWDDVSHELSGTCWEGTGASLSPPENAPSSPPYLEYDFTVNWAPDSTHVWVRAIGGHRSSEVWSGQIKTSEDNWRKSLYFQVIDGTTLAKGPIGGGPLNSIDFQRNRNIRFLEPGLDPDGDTDRWRWVKINNTALNLPNGPQKLRIYQGSTAFNLDKIIITNDPSGAFGDTRYNFLTFGPEGPAATPGSATREACNVCNPMYGQDITDGPNQCSCKVNAADNVANSAEGLAFGSAFNCTGVVSPTNMLLNDLFHDVDPLRSAQEAVKNFAARLDPKFDQLGVVAFNSAVVSKVKLQCLRYEQVNGTNGQRGCFDPTTNPITYARTIQAVEDYTAGETTDISEGMQEGLEELGISVGTTIGHRCDPGDPNEACDRQGAARRVLILMTDGSPNLSVFGDCRNSSKTVHWRGLVGTDTHDYNCSMYFAREAADSNVVVYTIGIGAGVDRTLLTAMAEGEVNLPDPEAPCDPVTNSNGHPCGDEGFYFNGRGGRYFPAARPSDLEAIFEQILDNIYVRIIG